MLDYVIEKMTIWSFCPINTSFKKRTCMEKMESILLKYPDCSGKKPYQQNEEKTGKHEKNI